MSFEYTPPKSYWRKVSDVHKDILDSASLSRWWIVGVNTGRHRWHDSYQGVDTGIIRWSGSLLRYGNFIHGHLSEPGAFDQTVEYDYKSRGDTGSLTVGYLSPRWGWVGPGGSPSRGVYDHLLYELQNGASGEYELVLDR